MKMAVFILTSLLVATTSFAAPSSITLTPGVLRKTYLSRNVQIARAMNDVNIAKAQVSQARASLLPAVNLGAVLGGGQNFMLNTVQVLLPFLLPSNWLNLRENQFLLDAQGQSYYLARLNGYASAYSLYATITGDIKLRTALQTQYDLYKEIEDELKDPAEAGIIRREDYLQAQAQTKMSLVQLSQVQELVKREKAAVRAMLGLPLTTEILFEAERVPASDYENYSMTSLLNKVQSRSPEISQLNYLVKAGQAATWKAAFSFLSGASMSTSRDPMGGFSQVKGLGTVDWGFGYFPAIELSNLNVRDIQLQRQQLAYEQGQLVEVNLLSLREAKIQYDAAAAAEGNLKEVYESELARYQAGIISIVDLLQIGTNQTNAIMARIKAATSIDTIRINLHRMTLSDQFQYIGGCKIQRKTGGDLGSIFKPKEQISLDQACNR
jgi:outer membrane protein TolC